MCVIPAVVSVEGSLGRGNGVVSDTEVRKNGAGSG